MLISDLEQLSNETREQAKKLANQIIYKDVSIRNDSVDRLIDNIISAAVLEITLIQKQAMKNE